MEDNKKKARIPGQSRQLTKEEKKELCQNSIKRVMPVLRALKEWQLQSLYSSFRY